MLALVRRIRVKLVPLLGVVLLVIGAVAASVIRDRTETPDGLVGARAAATSYVGLIARGRASDLPALSAMTVTGQMRALRSAGQLLIRAKSRIQDVTVGDVALLTSRPDVPAQLDADAFARATVHYRLAGRDRSGTVVLAELGRDGAAAHWKVVVPLTGSIDWASAGVEDDGETAVLLAGVRQPEDVLRAVPVNAQPLYPAVYAARARLGRWYASGAVSVPVAAGRSTNAPRLTLQPTARTVARIRGQVMADMAGCAPGHDYDDRYDCPFTGIAIRFGIADPTRGRWYRGLARRPVVTVDEDHVELADGVLRLLDGAGEVRRVRFEGSGATGFDKASRPSLLWANLLLTEAR